MATEKNIFFVNHFGSLDTGGAETTVRAWTNTFKERGVGVSWYGPQSKNGSESVPQGVNIKTIKKFKRFAEPQGIFKLIEDIKTTRPDGIIFSGVWEYPLSIIAALVATGQTKNLFVVLHGDQMPPTSNNRSLVKRLISPAYQTIRKPIINHLLNHKDIKVVAVSRDTAEKTFRQGLVDQNIKVCPPSIQHDGTECHPVVRVNTGKLIVETTCRISPEKGLESRFIPMALKAKERGMPIEFGIVGPVQDNKYYDHLVKKSQGTVAFRGVRKGVHLCDSYNKRHVTCLLSDTEGFGLVTIEGLIHGAVSLLTDLPPMRDIIQKNPLAARLIPVDNSGPERAVSFLRELITQKSLLEDMSRAALEIGKKYSPTETSSRLVNYVLTGI